MPDDLWIWGRHPVLEALRAGAASEVVIATGLAPSHVLRDIRSLAHRGRVPVRDVPAAELQRRFPGQTTQGVAARTSEPDELSVDMLTASVRAGQVTFVVALDQVQDPHNLGALLRTAVAAGVDAVLLPERRSAPLSGTTAKASAGAMSQARVVRAPNFARALAAVRAAGLWTVGLDADGEDSLFSVDLTVPLALVVGGEQKGLRRLSSEQCDLLANLPLLGAVESLNASVAGSIAMYEVVRQRGFAG
jgi:23S rRNA (guanosine2251-2'-O)-methyltransferase